MILYFIVVLLLMINDITASSAVEGDHDTDIECDDIPEAITYIHEHSPANATLEEKCMRYAVITSMIRPRGRNHGQTLSLILKLNRHQLSKMYREFDIDELSSHFMTAIDGLRAASMLGPALLDLVECLKKIDTPAVQNYLKADELNLILDFYKRIRESPDSKISFEDINEIGKFHRAFLVSLFYMFGEHFESDSMIYQSLKEKGSDKVSGDQPNYERSSRREERRRLGPHRHREQERLRRHRRKCLNPELERERELRRKERRRDLSRQTALVKQIQQANARRNTARFYLQSRFSVNQTTASETQRAPQTIHRQHPIWKDSKRYSPVLAKPQPQVAPPVILDSSNLQRQVRTVAHESMDAPEIIADPPDSPRRFPRWHRQRRRQRARRREDASLPDSDRMRSSEIPDTQFPRWQGRGRRWQRHPHRSQQQSSLDVGFASDKSSTESDLHVTPPTPVDQARSFLEPQQSTDNLASSHRSQEGPSTYPWPKEFRSEDSTYYYLLDTGVRDEQSHFDYGSRPIEDGDRFDDTDTVLQSFLGGNGTNREDEQIDTAPKTNKTDGD